VNLASFDPTARGSIELKRQRRGLPCGLFVFFRGF
jgi:hypothetical protein